jgi:hypothetical protein
MRTIVAMLVVCLCASVNLNAQSARVSGQVLDSQHTVIRGCQVVMRNADTAEEFRTTTTENGGFQLPPVPPGRYEIDASMAGFATAKLTSLVLELAESKVIELQLQPASVHESVTVSDRPDRSVVFDQTSRRSTWARDIPPTTPEY